MPIEIISALIGACATILAALIGVIGWIIYKRSETKKIKKVPLSDVISEVKDYFVSERPPGNLKIILTIGSGVLENVITVKTKIIQDQKYIAEREELIGGSALNYTFRLANTGYIALPISTVGRDLLGNKIQNEVSKLYTNYKISEDTLENLKAEQVPNEVTYNLGQIKDKKIQGETRFLDVIKKLINKEMYNEFVAKILEYVDKIEEDNFKQIFDFIKPEDFLCNNINTPHSTNLVSEGTRTIFAEELKGAINFKDFVHDRIRSLHRLKKLDVFAIMIGHIYADNPDLNPKEPGKITQNILEIYSDKALIFTNFGSSQIKLGYDFWQEYLKYIDIFQLSLSEARTFFKKNNNIVSLQDMIKEFRANSITAVITLDRFGAVATFKSDERIILAWPYELDEIVDPTGSGDAFGAGLVSALYEKKDFEFEDFQKAVRKARIWAAYACKTKGGTKDSPDNETLEEFLKGLKEFDPIEAQKLKNTERFLRLFDKAFS